MRKKCVLWAKPVLSTLAIIIGLGLLGSNNPLSAQSAPDPLTLPRLSFSDFTYLGGFRLPRELQGNDSFSYGGQNLAYNAEHNSLFGSSLHNNVAEVTIPQPVKTNDVNQMPFASYLQPFSDPSEGHFREIEQGGVNGALMSGLLVQGQRLYATGFIYYDGENSQRVSHFSHSTNLSEPSFRGMSQVWETAKSGFVDGYMASIPSEWQSLLGGPALTGQCCIPIITRTSFGPAAFGFEPANIGTGTAVGAAPLLYYTKEHATLGLWEGANERYGATSLIGGVAVIPGTRTALFIGRNGLGTYCYGHGVNDAALPPVAEDGQPNCYDPANSDKGPHAYPYRYQIWAYDLGDFAAVKAGTKQPWDVIPYAVWPFDLPIPERTVRIGGVAYDAQRSLLYISQYRADTDGYSERPIIHTLKVNAPTSTASLTSAPLTVSAWPSVTAPRVVGTSMTWTVAATGGKSPYEYKWFASSGGVTTLLRDWSASQTYQWQPVVAASDMKIIVWARSSGNVTDAPEAKTEYPFAISDTAPDITPANTPVASVALTTNLAAPQPAGSTIIWTATPTGGSGAAVYKWFVSNDGVSWAPVGTWTASNKFTWTPTVATANAKVSAWVKCASNPKDEWEANAERPFAIIDAAQASTPVASVALTANLPSPQSAGTPIVWTATPSGGSGALVYKWFVSTDGASWTTNGAWTASNQFTWTPAVAAANARVSAWVKRASNPKDEWEATAERQFTITAAAASLPVTSVALSTNVPAPQAAGSTIVWTATTTGGTGAQLYKWFVNDGWNWSPIGTWTPSNQFSWTPKSNGNYRVSVWVKRASSSKDEWEATTERPFAIADPSYPVASVALTSDLPAPQEVASTIVWTATATGGTGAIVYKWFTTDGVTSNAMGSWTSSNQFSWTPSVANSNYRIAVWAKRASNAADAAEALAEQSFPIQEPVIGVALVPNLPSPQPLSSTIEWTATPEGGASDALVYKWFVSTDDGATWSAAGPWAASNRISWTPTAVNPKYRLSVWVKHATDPADYPEASAQRRFAIKK